eukprot:g12175.t1.1.5e1746ac g12175  g12175.t1 contig6:1378909-1379829(+)
MHECESELVCKLSHSESKVPYFNAGIFLENKKKIGKVDEIFGPINLVMFTVKMDPGVVAKSFEMEDVVYVGTDKLLPMSRFTSPGGGGSGGGRSGGRGGGRYVCIQFVTFALSIIGISVIQRPSSYYSTDQGRRARRRKGRANPNGKRWGTRRRWWSYIQRRARRKKSGAWFWWPWQRQILGCFSLKGRGVCRRLS